MPTESENNKRVKDMLREVIRIGYAGNYAARMCSLNRARDLLTEIDGMQRVNASTLLECEPDENMPGGEILLRFPPGQEHKNFRIVNIGESDG